MEVTPGDSVAASSVVGDLKAVEDRNEVVVGVAEKREEALPPPAGFPPLPVAEGLRRGVDVPGEWGDKVPLGELVAPPPAAAGALWGGEPEKEGEELAVMEFMEVEVGSQGVVDRRALEEEVGIITEAVGLGLSEKNRAVGEKSGEGEFMRVDKGVGVGVKPSEVVGKRGVGEKWGVAVRAKGELEALVLGLEGVAA